MLYSLIGYYALILGLSISFLIFFFSIKNFRNNEILDNKINIMKRSLNLTFRPYMAQKLNALDAR